MLRRKKDKAAEILKKADIVVADFDETFTKKNAAELLARKHALRFLLNSLRKGELRKTMSELKVMTETLRRRIGKGYEGAAVYELLKQLEARGVPRESIVKEVQELRRKHLDIHGIRLLEELAREKPVFLITFGPAPDIEIKGVKKISNPVWFEGKKNLMYSFEEKQKALEMELKKLGKREGKIAFIGDKKELPEKVLGFQVSFLESPYAKKRFGTKIKSYKKLLKNLKKA